MIITKDVLVTVSGKSKTYYEQKGYTLPYTKDSRGRLGIKRGTKLSVSVYDLPKMSNVKIKYKCDDCDVIKVVSACTLFGRSNSQYNKTGETLCSLCANKRMSGVNSGAYKHGNIRYPEYIYNARRRGLDFKLTVKEFETLTNKTCHYCAGNSKDRFTNSRGNGIDRKDSNVGYIIFNCVSCCSTCNFIKNKMGYKDFILYIRQINKVTQNYEI